MEKTNELIWKWDNKDIPLTKLDDAQLESIKKTVLKSKHSWFNQKPKVWVDNINTILANRSKYRTNKLINDIIDRRRLSACKKSIDIINKFPNLQKFNKC